MDGTKLRQTVTPAGGTAEKTDMNKIFLLALCFWGSSLAWGQNQSYDLYCGEFSIGSASRPFGMFYIKLYDNKSFLLSIVGITKGYAIGTYIVTKNEIVLIPNKSGNPTSFQNGYIGEQVENLVLYKKKNFFYTTYNYNKIILKKEYNKYSINYFPKHYILDNTIIIIDEWAPIKAGE